MIRCKQKYIFFFKIIYLYIYYYYFILLKKILKFVIINVIAAKMLKLIVCFVKVIELIHLYVLVLMDFGNSKLMKFVQVFILF